MSQYVHHEHERSLDLMAVYGRERLLLEFQRMSMAGFLPSDVDPLRAASCKDMVVEWLEIFHEADLFVSNYSDFIAGAHVISELPLRAASRHSLIADAYHYATSPPKYIYDRCSWYSRGDHPAVTALRKSLISALFVDPGVIGYFNYPKNRIMVDESVVERKYPNRGFVRLWEDSPYAKPIPKKDSFLIFHPHMMIGQSRRGHLPDAKENSITVELTLPHSSILMFLDIFDSVDTAQLIARKITQLADGTQDVRTMRLHPNPVFAHYSSKTGETHYAVPMHIALGDFSVIPGTNSPDCKQIPYSNEKLYDFAF